MGLLAADNRDREGGEVSRPAPDDIADIDRSDTRRRAGVDKVPRLQPILPGELADDLGAIPNHLRKVAFLANLVVDSQADRPSIEQWPAVGDRKSTRLNSSH